MQQKQIIQTLVLLSSIALVLVIGSVLLVLADTPAFAFGSKGEILVNAGSKARDNCPVTVPIPKDSSLYKIATSGKPLRAISPQQTAPLAVLPAKEGIELGMVVNGMKIWGTRTYQIDVGSAFSANAVSFREKTGGIDITIGGKPFTTYDYTTENKKKLWPFFYPLFGPQGVRMTRGYPMEKFEGERQDHPHHQSLWVSHGDINGVNFWHLGDNHGYTQQRSMNSSASPAAGRISAVLDWTDHDGKKIFEEERIVTIWGTSESGRMIDFDMTFKATEGDVKFGDTKEGGLISLRVAASMRELQQEGVPGGTITNSEGKTGAKECWGKPASWCDYSGPVGGHVVGLTIMDHPTNPFYPIRYHVRDYGLFTANPFGLSHFIDKSKDGSRVLKKGQSWHLKFRVYIHAGDVKEGRVAECYNNFSEPPLVQIR